jgi:hypothetical protein
MKEADGSWVSKTNEELDKLTKGKLQYNTLSGEELRGYDYRKHGGTVGK